MISQTPTFQADIVAEKSTLLAEADSVLLLHKCS